MKTLTYFLCLFGLAIFGNRPVFAAVTSCPDISGRYSQPGVDDNSNIVFSYRQSKCDFLIIGGYSINETSHSSTRYSQITFPLNGQPPVDEGMGRCFKSAPNVCASYKASPNLIIKTRDREHTGLVQAPNGGICDYHVSHLFKDEQGNLVEDFEIENCDNGYTGKVPPRIFRAVKKGE